MAAEVQALSAGGEGPGFSGFAPSHALGCALEPARALGPFVLGAPLGAALAWIQRHGLVVSVSAVGRAALAFAPGGARRGGGGGGAGAAAAAAAAPGAAGTAGGWADDLAGDRRIRTSGNDDDNDDDDDDISSPGLPRRRARSGRRRRRRRCRAAADIVVLLREDGLVLRFSARDQRLTRVDCFDLSRAALTYRERPVSGPDHLPTLDALGELFGPTHAGTYDRQRREYVLRYPGLCFRFAIPAWFEKLYLDLAPPRRRRRRLPRRRRRRHDDVDVDHHHHHAAAAESDSFGGRERRRGHHGVRGKAEEESSGGDGGDSDSASDRSGRTSDGVSGDGFSSDGSAGSFSSDDDSGSFSDDDSGSSREAESGSGSGSESERGSGSGSGSDGAADRRRGRSGRGGTRRRARGGRGAAAAGGGTRAGADGRVLEAVPLTVFPDGTTPVATRVVVHELPSARQRRREEARVVGTTVTALAAQEVPNGGATTAPFYFEPVVAQLGVGLTFPARGVSLGFDSSPQDVVSAFGPPEDVFFKEEDKMQIHMPAASPRGAGGAGDGRRGRAGSSSSSSSSSSSAAAPRASSVASAAASTGVGGGSPGDVFFYFYNYFSLGLDVLFSSERHTVVKFVLHTNYPFHAEFNQYVKCNFRVALPDGSTVTCDSRWDAVQSAFARCRLRPGRPVVNMRPANSSPFGPTLFYGFDFAVFEVVPDSGYLSSMCLFRPLRPAPLVSGPLVSAE